MHYATERTIRLTGLVLAVVVASVLNGSLLWKFDAVAQTAAANNQPATIVLQPVTVVGHQS